MKCQVIQEKAASLPGPENFSAQRSLGTTLRTRVHFPGSSQIRNSPHNSQPKAAITTIQAFSQTQSLFYFLKGNSDSSEQTAQPKL